MNVYTCLFLFTPQTFAGNQLPFVGFTYTKGYQPLGGGSRSNGVRDGHVIVMCSTCDSHVSCT